MPAATCASLLDTCPMSPSCFRPRPPATPRPPRNCSRWFTRNSAGSRRRRWPSEARGHTLQPTALVHEAWLRLAGDEAARFENRAHFFGAAAEAMRRILIDRARRRLAAKRGAASSRWTWTRLKFPPRWRMTTACCAVNEALEKFAAMDPRKAELVKLRYFVGMNFEEAAAALGHRRAHGQAVVGLRPRLAHGRDARLDARLISRSPPAVRLFGPWADACPRCGRIPAGRG